jgi:tape measure domain-containing protein
LKNDLTYRLTLKDFFRKTMQGAASDTKRLDDGMGKLERTVGRVGKLAAGYFAFGSIKDFAVDVVQSTARMQSFNNSIMASARNEAEGANNLRFLNSEVDRLGTNLFAAQAGYKTFQGSVMGTNIQGAKANTIFRQVSEASTVLGLSAEQTEGSFLALGQMISKGTVQAEELRGQLAERIPGAFQIGARAMGVSTEKLGDMMKEGLVKADDFLVKFGNELEKTFGGKLANALQSTTAQLNRMGTAWERLKVNIGNSQSGIINSTISFLGQMTSALSKYFENANIMSANFAAKGAKDFGFWAKAAHESLGILSGYGVGYAPIQQQENFQADVYGRFVDKQPKTISEAYGNKAELYRMTLEKTRQYKRGDLSREEADRYQATLQGALKAVNQTIAGFQMNKIAAAGIKGADKKTGSAAIGSATEVYGARPQNINIKLEKLGDVIIHNHSKDMKETAAQAKEIWSKQMLEVLNDANQMSK